MNKYSIEIRYAKGPTFSTWAQVESAEQAKSLALKTARSWGFDQKVKKIIVRVEHA